MLGRGIHGGALTLTYDATIYEVTEVKGPEGVLMATNADRPGEMRIHLARAEAREPAVLRVVLEIDESTNRRIDESRSSFIVRVTGQVFGPEGGVIGTVEEVWGRPLTHSLSVAYPNPFNPVTTLRYDLAEEGEVRLMIYNLSGQVVRQLVAGRQAAGRYSVVWDGRDEGGRSASSGVYLARLEAGAFQQTRKMLLLK
ncbi:MAG: hypothetical protein A3F84_24055 [Candidatus Handelsmanbacteria bacterium RIFCSPLOWO2_12_FULL_64_10]|uniref:FlgD/Vpr Ig-like domain-containing protein n=1 Tax=Handelsmanbacteria sp. (strain RIFCSPLOWO2_12_FULL_64_10) TaxID=1817868 RepID=A0A1F6C480_HANXR|nr:MAG: hypothetical protein A3F84_24055 [Candidatus Handelsmanbacteria bacterium RIFCSPLOWO2_12_FULL_64_10]